MNTFATLTLSVMIAASSASAAVAHPQIKMADPKQGGTIKTPPQTLSLAFNEGIVLAFSGMDVTNAKGEKQPVGAASLDSGGKRLTVPLQDQLAPGTYTVAWHAVGDDTHRVQGRYSFTVKP